MISLADKLSNLRSIWADYQTIGDEVFDRFNIREKKDHGWYYRSMRDQYIGLKGTDAWKEYSDLIEKIFGPDRVSAVPTESKEA